MSFCRSSKSLPTFSSNVTRGTVLFISMSLPMTFTTMTSGIVEQLAVGSWTFNQVEMKETERSRGVTWSNELFWVKPDACLPYENENGLWWDIKRPVWWTWAKRKRSRRMRNQGKKKRMKEQSAETCSIINGRKMMKILMKGTNEKEKSRKEGREREREDNGRKN